MIESSSLSSQIRPVVLDDLERLLVWRNHPTIRRYMYTQHAITPDEHLQWFNRASQDQKKHLFIFEENHQPLGFINFSELTCGGGIANWGFYIAPDAPRGSGRQLGRAALSHAFSALRFHKICGQALAYNERSIQLHQSLGFAQEGILRDQHFDGERYHHSICFGLLGLEWQAKP